jgi:hypothetical protein
MPHQNLINPILRLVAQSIAQNQTAEQTLIVGYETKPVTEAPDWA